MQGNFRACVKKTFEILCPGSKLQHDWQVKILKSINKISFLAVVTLFLSRDWNVLQLYVCVFFGGWARWGGESDPITERGQQILSVKLQSWLTSTSMGMRIERRHGRLQKKYLWPGKLCLREGNSDFPTVAVRFYSSVFCQSSWWYPCTCNTTWVDPMIGSQLTVMLCVHSSF